MDELTSESRYYETAWWVLKWLKACTGYVQAYNAFKTRLESISRTIAPTQPKDISKMSDRRVYFHKS